MKRILLGALSSLFLLSQVYADTVSNTTKATASLSATCGFNISDIDFGQVNPGATNVLSSTTLNTLCTKGTPYKIQIQYSAQDYAESSANLRGKVSGNKIGLGISYPNSTTQYYDTRSDYYSTVGTGDVVSYTITAKLAYIPYVTPDIYMDQLTVYVIV